MFRGFSRNAKHFDVIVAGSVLVDVIAKSDTDSGDGFDLPGRLDEYRIGGCAYNIYVHLSQQQTKPILCTGLKRQSLFSNFIIAKIRDHCRDLSLIALGDISEEPVFVCQMREKEVYVAITSTCVASCDLDYDRIKFVAKEAVCFVLDCSLSETQITQLLKIARSEGCKVVFNGTSDGRISILRAIRGWATPIDLLVCNKKEFEALNYGKPVDFESADPRHICNIGMADVVAITFGEQGYSVYRKDGRPARHYPAVAAPKNIVSTIGAGDALTAAFAVEVVQAASQGRDADPEKAFIIFSGLFSSIANELGSTVASGSLYSHDILPPPEGVYQSYKTLWLSRHTWNRINPPIAAFGVIVTVIAILLAVWPVVRASGGFHSAAGAAGPVSLNNSPKQLAVICENVQLNYCSSACSWVGCVFMSMAF